MRTDAVIAAELRESRGKNEARRTRMRGMIPAVVYGAFKDPVAVTVNPKPLQAILRGTAGHNAIFNLDIPGQDQTPVMVVDEQYDPVKSNLLHVDMKRIDLTKRLKVGVPVVTHGEPIGVKAFGGVFQVVNRLVEIECLPEDIPQQFVMDVVELNLGDAIRASNLPLSGSMKLLTPADTVIVHVVAPRGEVVAEVDATAAPVAVPEPEVIKKGKKEEAAAEPEKKKK